MSIIVSYGPDLVEEIDWRQRVKFNLTHHGAVLRVEPNKIGSLMVSAFGFVAFVAMLFNGAALAMIAAPAFIVVAGICSYLTKVTYLLEPGMIQRQVQFLGWTRARTFAEGRLALEVTHDDKEAPEVSVWRWVAQIESDGKRVPIIRSEALRHDTRFNTDRAHNCLVALAEACAWPTDVRMIYCRRPRRGVRN